MEPISKLFEQTLQLPSASETGEPSTYDSNCLLSFDHRSNAVFCLGFWDLHASVVDITSPNKPIVANTGRIEPTSIGTSDCF